MIGKKLYIGKIAVTFSDGPTKEITIHKNGRTIWIDDHIVHPSNRNSFEGVIHEIGVITNKRIEKWEWKIFGPDYNKLKFRKYKIP